MTPAQALIDGLKSLINEKHDMILDSSASPEDRHSALHKMMILEGAMDFIIKEMPQPQGAR